MRRYDGIKVAKAKVSPDDIYISYSKRKKDRKKPLFLVRYIVAAALFATFFGISKLNNKFAQKTIDTVKTAILYDLDANENKQCGEIPVFDELKEIKEE